MSDKKKYGQFYTITNPFKNNTFFKWYNGIKNINEITILEPFAGANNIIELIEELNIKQPKNWKCYDLFPSENNKCENYIVEKKDTLKEFPKNFDVIITNPPYLAKNKATKLGIEFDNNYNDLYLKALKIMLDNAKYIAAIIPESYITSNKYTERLFAIVSLEMKMFDETDCPVCLALFVPENTKDFYIVKNDIVIGKYNELKEYIREYDTEINYKFNDKNGNIGLRAVDDTKKASIEFCVGEKITSEIKVSSRAITKISGLNFKNNIVRDTFINKLNENLDNYRNITKDIFLTSFKGLRADNKYRRRLDYRTARMLLNKTYLEFDWSING